jgi:hypothetical protein
MGSRVFSAYYCGTMFLHAHLLQLKLISLRSKARSPWPFLVHVNVRARSALFRNRLIAGVGDLSKAAICQ